MSVGEFIPAPKSTGMAGSDSGSESDDDSKNIFRRLPKHLREQAMARTEGQLSGRTRAYVPIVKEWLVGDSPSEMCSTLFVERTIGIMNISDDRKVESLQCLRKIVAFVIVIERMLRLWISRLL